MDKNLSRARQSTNIDPDLDVNPVFVRPGEAITFDKFSIPAGPSLPDTAYQIVHDEAMLDGNSRLNLATFVSTWMDDEAKRLYLEAADKNMIDKDEYPGTAAIEDRCWRMIAELWNVPDTGDTIGTSTIGSSEACMLGGLALKRRWQERRTAAGASTASPNLVMSAAVQVVWEKFCNYWDVEARYVPVTPDRLVLDGERLEEYVDENTIPVFAWVLKDGHTKNWNLYDLADRLRMKGWLVPAYPMVDDMSDVVLQRIVVRVGLSKDLATSLLADIRGAVEYLDALDAPLPREVEHGSPFRH